MRNLPLSNLAQLSRTSRPKRHFLPAIYQLLTPRNRPFSQNSTLELVAHLKSQTQALIDHLKTQRNSLEQRFSTLSQEISKVSGYANIEELKHSVTEAEQFLNDARDHATAAKNAYTTAVEARSASQRETNDLLSRKNNWSSHDVSRFTELVQQDHVNEHAEKEAKVELNRAEESVETGLSTLMRSILNRYHEEQVWSDKIRSLSTYGSLAITGANVLVFLLAVILVEPWRRRRLVDKLEVRLAEREAALLAQTDAGFQKLVDRVDALVGAPASPESLKTESSDASLPIIIEEKEEDQTDESIKGQPQRNESAPLWPPQLDWVYVYQVKERVDWPSSAVGFGAGIVFAGLASLLLGR